MSYRYALAPYDRPATAHHKLDDAVWALAGVGSAIITTYLIGWSVVPPWIAALVLTAAILSGIVSRVRRRPAGEIFFMRANGLWQGLESHQLVDARHMAGNPPPGRLELGYRGGFAAATVCDLMRSGRRAAGCELVDVTFLVAAPGTQAYRTRMLLVPESGDEQPLRSGQVLLAARFDPIAPDISLLPAAFLSESVGKDRLNAEAALASALNPSATPRLPIRDSASYRLMTRGYNQFWTLHYERPSAIWRSIVNRGAWLRPARRLGIFLGAFFSCVTLVLLAIVLHLLVPMFDGSGPAAYN